MRVRDKVLVVTGGGNGIGREVVLLLLAKGARVAAVDRSDAGLEETAEIAGAGERLSTHVLDITDRDAVLAFPDVVRKAHGPVDGLVNVAGIIQEFVPVSELGFDAIERVMAVNFWGTVNTTKAFLPALEARPEAALVNVASMGCLVPVPGQSAYGASKAAVKLFTEGLVAEHQGSRLKVGVVLPGGVATDIVGHSGVEAPHLDAAAQAKAAKGLTTPQDAAQRIVEAIEKGSPRVVIGRDAQMLDVLGRLMPSRAIAIVARRMKELVG